MKKILKSNLMLCPLLLAVALLLAADAGQPDAKRKAPKTIAEGQGCSSKDCHPGLAALKYSHNEDVECDACHEQAEKGKHEFAKIEEPAELCLTCHEEDEALAVVHAPYKDACLDCHDPHGGQHKQFLKHGGGEALCLECHDHPKDEFKSVHAPAAIGACWVCHAAHQSAGAHLLREPQDTLCRKCHKPTPGNPADVNAVHLPERDKVCTNCHGGHGGQTISLLQAPRKALCRGCHAGLLARQAALAVKHQAVTAPDVCQTCHRPHPHAEDDELLIGEVNELCLTCHSRAVEAPDGRSIPPVMPAVADESVTWHAPLEDGDCTDCHFNHGSTDTMLLIAPIPATIEGPFQIEQHELCLSCHDKDTVLEKEYEDTEFRNGTQNLHFLHVNREKGQACRACHAPHGVKGPHLLHRGGLAEAPELKLEFRPTETGGSCQTSCHETYASAHLAYDREKPAINKKKDAADSGGVAEK